jgi:uncharacterized protein YhfF
VEPALGRILASAFPGEAARYFLPMSVGSAPEHADEGAALILNGTKTLTSSLVWDYADGKLPFEGALSVLLNGLRQPCAIVATTRVKIMPFAAITEEMARAYGEGERTIEWWLRAMGEFYGAAAVRHSAVLTKETPLIWEWSVVMRYL